MNLLLDRIRKNREYGEIIKTLRARASAARRYPSLVTGLCEGALDAFLAACVYDEERGIPALICVPEEKSAMRLFSTLSAFGLRVSVYPERDPVLYNIVSSHELEHERIAVLTDLSEGRLDAVIAPNDLAASYLMRNLQKRGRQIPADIAVAGFDNEPFSGSLYPSLTTIDDNNELIARYAFELLLEQLNGETPARQPKTVCVTPRIVRRQSI